MAVANATLIADIVNPLVMADMIQAELEKKLRATEFIQVNRELVGRPGDTINIPTWKYIGPAEDLPENTEGEITVMDFEDVEYTVKKAVKNVALTDEAVLSGFGDPVGEATRQLRMSIQDKIDNDAVEQLAGITAANGHVLTATAGLDFDTVVDAIDLLNLEEQGTTLFLMTNKLNVTKLRKDPRFVDRETLLGDSYFGTGVIGQISGARVIMSNKLPSTRSYILTPACLTLFLKRDTSIETDRKMLSKVTLIGSDCHYIVAIEDYDKIVAINHS